MYLAGMDPLDTPAGPCLHCPPPTLAVTTMKLPALRGLGRKVTSVGGWIGDRLKGPAVKTAVGAAATAYGQAMQAGAQPAPQPAQAASGPGVNIGGGVGMTFGTPMGIPVYIWAVAVALVVWLAVRKR